MNKENDIGSRALPILIVGAGVVGLALGQGLKAHNIPFRIFERYAQGHASQGHRFRLRDAETLRSLLPQRLKELFDRTCARGSAYEPRYVNAKTFEFPPPTVAGPGSSTPIDRSWIRSLLMVGIEEHVQFGRQFPQYKAVDGSVTAHFTDGTLAQGCLLVAADGLKSAVRRQLQPRRKLLDLERQIMWCRTPKMHPLLEQLPDDALTWHMAKDDEANTQAIIEPMTWKTSVHATSDGLMPNFEDYIYCILMTAPTEPRPVTAEQKKAFAMKTVEAWHPALRLIFSEASYDQAACVSVLSSKPDIDILSPSEARVLLIGDAAHPMSPMGGAGGDTAIWGAAELVRTIYAEGINVASLTGFKMRLSQRAQEKIEQSFAGGQRYWLGREWHEYAEAESVHD